MRTYLQCFLEFWHQANEKLISQVVILLLALYQLLSVRRPCTTFHSYVYININYQIASSGETRF